jgi:hypothetical protein
MAIVHLLFNRLGAALVGLLAVAATSLVLTDVELPAARGATVVESPGSGLTTADSGTAVCTWGGTPAAPTGRLTITPGTTNTPSAGRLKFRAWGPLAGGGRCSGTMTFVGALDAGSNCLAQVFEGRVLGVPGIARFWGPGAVGMVHEFLYDKGGNLVGADQPQILTNATEGNPLFMDCGTPKGFTSGNFSALVELYASGR